jgi:hypothetical protein
MVFFISCSSRPTTCFQKGTRQTQSEDVSVSVTRLWGWCCNDFDKCRVPFLPKKFGLSWTFVRQASNPVFGNKKCFHPSFADRLWLFRSCQSLYIIMRVLLTDFGRCVFAKTFPAKLFRPVLDFFSSSIQPNVSKQKVFILVCRPILVVTFLTKYFRYHASFADQLWLFRFWQSLSAFFWTFSVKHPTRRLETRNKKWFHPSFADRLWFFRCCQSIYIIMRVLLTGFGCSDSPNNFRSLSISDVM